MKLKQCNASDEPVHFAPGHSELPFSVVQALGTCVASSRATPTQAYPALLVPAAHLHLLPRLDEQVGVHDVQVGGPAAGSEVQSAIQPYMHAKARITRSPMYIEPQPLDLASILGICACRAAPLLQPGDRGPV